MDIPARELEALFDALPDVVFFVKDSEGRYPPGGLIPTTRFIGSNRSR
jgi:hypothetical protein